MGAGDPAGFLVHEILGWLKGADIDGILVRVLHSLTRARGRLKGAPLLDPVEAANDLRRLNDIDRPVADPRKDMDLQMPDDLLGIARGPFPILLRAGVPGTGQEFKGIKSG